MPLPRPAFLAQTGLMVLNREDPEVMAMLPAARDGARKRQQDRSSVHMSPLAATCRAARATSVWKSSTA